LQAYIRALGAHGIKAPFLVVFGSWVKGRADEESDIDVIVVSPQFDKRIRYSDVGLLWTVAADIDSRIEPIPCGERQWTDDDSSAIIEIARREGVRIPARPTRRRATPLRRRRTAAV
jgi:predicted nucleotidyltransferase